MTRLLTVSILVGATMTGCGSSADRDASPGSVGASAGASGASDDAEPGQSPSAGGDNASGGTPERPAPGDSGGGTGTNASGAGGTRATGGSSTSSPSGGRRGGTRPTGGAGSLSGGASSAQGGSGGGGGSGAGASIGTGGTSGSGASPNASPGLSDEIEPDALWVAKDGSDSNPGTAEAPFATLAHGFERLSPGRMLVVRDGTYDEPVFSYYGSGIPSGKEDDYTVVRAEHDFGVTINAAGFTGREAVQWPLELEGEPVQYIHIRGIRFRANPDGQADAALINYANHVKITRCAFFDAPDSGGAHVATVRNSEYVLLEECHAWGGGRYKFLVFESDRTVLRRCVGRYDRYDSPPDAMPMGVFSSYLSTNTALENCIAIDSDQEQYYLTSGGPGTLWGGFYFPNGGSAGARVMGSIALNMGGLAGLYNDQAVGSQEVENTVVWDSRGGVFYAGDRASVSVSHATVGAITGKTADESYAWGTGVYCFDGLSECNVRNSLLTQCSEFGVADWLTSDYNDFFDNGQGAYGKIRYEASAPTPGANDLQVDPGLRYLPRPESGSALVGAASDGGAMGATILYRYGATGSVWGDPGWDQLTDEPLWPFPNEAEIKKDMASFAGPPDGTRGFCAPGNGLYGGPITLTSYIWEYLGNACPSDICGSP